MVIYTVKNSSCIKRLAYCKHCHTLRIKFINGGVYEYSPIGPSLYKELKHQDTLFGSVGKYYRDYIYDRYNSTNLVSSSDIEGTKRFDMDANCHCKTNTLKPKNNVEAWEKIFGSANVSEDIKKSLTDPIGDDHDIDVELKFIYDGKKYDSLAKAKKAKEKANSPETKLIKLVNEVFDDGGEITIEDIVGFILGNKGELKQILGD